MNIRRLLCTLSGDDYNIIIRCKISLQNRFVAIGFLVACIFILCFVSSYFTFGMIFQNYVAGIPIAIFFAWMVTNIYLLLLYTLSKNVLPHKSKGTARSVSIGIRVLFIGFLCIVISKPIEVLIFDDDLENKIVEFKSEKIRMNTDSIAYYYQDKIKLINAMQVKLNSPELGEYVGRVQKQKYEALSKMKTLVISSNYYVHRIRLLNQNYKSWLITLFCFFVFITPAYLKSFISSHSNYYTIKKYIETKIVRENYEEFKTLYRTISSKTLQVKLSRNTEIFLNEFASAEAMKTVGENSNSEIQKRYADFIGYKELYEDPPFNTMPIKDKREFLDEDDLIAELYNA